MDIGRALRLGRLRSGLTQAELARRAHTSQATISSYESGRKQPSTSTLERLLNAAGWRLTVDRRERPVIERSHAELSVAGRVLTDVLGLAEALPARHTRQLRYPRLQQQRPPSR